MMRILRVPLVLALSLPFLPGWSQHTQMQGQNPAAGASRQIFFDADTANEVDDLYAIVRALSASNWQLTALASAQWQASHLAPDNSIDFSQQLNERLLAMLGRQDIPSPRGGHRRMYDWGDPAIYSAAAWELIRQAREVSDGQKLDVVAVGALTNIASALTIAPDIASKIRLHWLGSTYDWDRKEQGLTDFNAMMDPQAARIMFESSVEMYVLPVSELYKVQTSLAFAKTHLADKAPVGPFLIQRWEQHMDGSYTERILWDLHLVELMLHPEWARLERISGIKNNQVWYYRDLQIDPIVKSGIEEIAAYLAKGKN